LLRHSIPCSSIIPRASELSEKRLNDSVLLQVATAHAQAGVAVTYQLCRHLDWLAHCFDWNYCFVAQSIQEAKLAPYIPMERVNRMPVVRCIHMKIRHILSLWVFDTKPFMASMFTFQGPA
jgi:hypothetical protein